MKIHALPGLARRFFFAHTIIDGTTALVRLNSMLRPGMTAILFLHLVLSPVLSAPGRGTIPSIFLEGCNVSIELEAHLVPVEIQADSFLGSNTVDRTFVALVCRPNPRRTFDPGEGRLAEQALRIKRENQTSTSQFFTASSEGTNVPLPGIHSWSLRWATRSHLFHLMVYADPRAPRNRKPLNGAGRDEGINDGGTERLEHIATRLILHEGGEPAILETTYRRRLWATGALLVLLLSGAGFIIFVRIQRRLGRHPNASAAE